MSSVRGALCGHPVHGQDLSQSERGENLPPAGSSHHRSGAVMNVAACFELRVHGKAAHVSVLCLQAVKARNTNQLRCHKQLAGTNSTTASG